MREITITTLKCPVCGEFLSSESGDQINPNHGVMVSCRNKACSMADWGWGKKLDEAYKIFRQKCGKE